MAISTDDRAVIAETRTSSRIRWYVLAVLVGVGALSWIDRQMLAMVLQSVKTEFHLSDTELGLLGGTAFGVFYVSVGLPMAWLADRFNRRNILSLAVGFWSLMTALCAFAGGYWSLLLIRTGVGLGEAGQSPPSQSMVCDYFPPERRGIAMALLYLYLPIGYLISYSAGGIFNDTIGWRNSFLVFGVTGIAVALLVRLTVPEPTRGRFDSRSSASVSASPPESLAASVQGLISRPSMRHVPLAGAAHGIGMYAAALWLPSYFIRVHHMTSTATGVRLALIMGIAGTLGTLAGGHLSDRLARRFGDSRWYLWTCGTAVVSTVPFTLAMYLTSNATTALLLFIGPTLLNHMILGPIVATVQSLAGPRRRAVAAAVYLFLSNMISMGLGPLLVGFISDELQSTLGNDALRYSLLILCSGASCWAALHLFLATRTVRQDIAAATLGPGS